MITPGHCILSHGFESGPDATKVTALAAAAERLGWTNERPDYTGFDARRDMSELGDVEARQAHLLALASAAAARGPLVLAGSSLGAYISARISLEVPVVGLFLMAPPTRMGRLAGLDAAAVPTSVIHGWDDELIPAQQVIDWAHPRRARLLLVNDAHRLSEHVEASAEAFAVFLQSIKQAVISK
jgi:predicted alpha/beta-hydrolase family hydrolase